MGKEKEPYRSSSIEETYSRESSPDSSRSATPINTLDDITLNEDYQPTVEPKTNPFKEMQRYSLECDELLVEIIDDVRKQLVKMEIIGLNDQVKQALILSEDIDSNLEQIILILEAATKIETISIIDDYETPSTDTSFEEKASPIHRNLALCKQVQLHLQLKKEMKTWFINSEDQVQLRTNIETTYLEMAKQFPHCHPRTVNLLNRTLLEVNGWIELKKLWSEYQKLVDTFGPTDRKTGVKRKECLDKIRLIANQLNISGFMLRELTELDEAESRKPLSTEWFLQHANILLDQESPYLIYEQGRNELTEAGVQRVQRILKEALNPFAAEIARPKHINQKDLVLLTQYLGRDKMQFYAQKYALYGDGTSEHPFNMDNLRAILVGMAANRTIDAESPELKKTLDDVTYQCCNPNVSLGCHPRMLQAFNNRTQNDIPQNKDHSFRWGSIPEAILRWGREISYSAVSESKERYAAAYLLSLNMPYYFGAAALFATLSHTEIDNHPGRDYLDDLRCLQAQAPLVLKEKKPIPDLVTPEAAIADISADLANCAHYEDFEEMYPMFNRENAHVSEVDTLIEYFNTKKNTGSAEIPLEMISAKVFEVGRLLRGERIAHDLAYINLTGKDDSVFDLKDRNLNTLKFKGKAVIPPETGLGVTLYSPTVDQEIPDKQQIPLMIVFPGTQNQMGFVRDMETRAPGKRQWEIDSVYKRKVLRAINEEIKRLKETYGEDAKISLESLGHSLGGADAMQMQLVLMEAMVQNLFENNPDKVNAFRQKIEDQEMPDDMKERLLLGLDSAIGALSRPYQTLWDSAENRFIQKEDRNFINQDNISIVSSFCDLGAGNCKEDAYAASACMALLADETEINQDALDVEGDAIRKMGAAPHYGIPIDPNLEIYQDKKIHLNAVWVQTGIGSKKGGWLTNMFSANKIAPLIAHTCLVFGKNPYAASIGVKSGQIKEEHQQYQDHVSERWIKSRWIRGLKWGTRILLLSIRIPAEFIIKYPLLKVLPEALRIGSRKYDDTEKGRAEDIRLEREQLNILKRAFNLSVRNTNNMEEKIKKTPRGKRFLDKFSNSQFDEIILHNPKYRSILFEEVGENFTKNELLYEHLKHQLTKAQQYLQRWQSKIADIDQILDTDIPQEYRDHLTNERTQIETEITHQQSLVNELSKCLDTDGTLNATACIKFMQSRLPNPEGAIPENLMEKNSKTLSLETKIMMPIIMVMQEHRKERLKSERKKSSVFSSRHHIRSEEEQELNKYIKVYRNFLKQDKLLSKNVMSSKWLLTHSAFYTDIEEPSPFIAQKNDHFVLTRSGLDHLDNLFKRALRDPLSNDHLTQEDLVLLGHFYGRRCVKKTMDRYGLKGDGTPEFPFSMDNLRMLMIGSAIFHKPEYLDAPSEEHKELLKQTLDTTIQTVTHPDKQMGSIKRILDNLVHYEQNDLPVGSVLRAISRSMGRAYFTAIDFMIKLVGYKATANLSTSPLSADPEPLILASSAAGASALVLLLATEKPSYNNFYSDLRQLFYARSAQVENRVQVIEAKEEEPVAVNEDTSGHTVNTAELIVDAIKEYLNTCDGLEDFFDKYPMFKSERVFFDEENEAMINSIITKRVQQIIDWGRAENIANVDSLYTNRKDGGLRPIADRDGNRMMCNATTVTDTGIPNFQFNCYWPEEKPQDNKPIPLIITIPENIDIVNIQGYFAPLTRWAALFRAGHNTLEENAISQAERFADDVRRENKDLKGQKFKKSWLKVDNESRRQYAKRQIIAAIDKQIDQIMEKHGPDAEISIELFGRGVAASQCHQLELYILEAIAARRTQSSTFKLNEDLDQKIKQGMFSKSDNPAEHIGKAKIVGIHSYAFSGVGEPEQSARERASLVGYLAHDKAFKVEHNSFNVTGDPSAYLGEDHADRYINTDAKEYQGKGIEINHVTTDSDRGLEESKWFINGVLKGEIDTKNLSAARGRFTGPNRFQSKSTIMSEGNPNLYATLNEQSGHSKAQKLHSERPETFWNGIWHDIKTGASNAKDSMVDAYHYGMRKLFLRSVLYPTSKGSQGLKWFTYHPIYISFSKHFREKFYTFVSTKGLDAEAKRDKKTQAHEEKVKDKFAGSTRAMKNKLQQSRDSDGPDYDGPAPGSGSY